MSDNQRDSGYKTILLFLFREIGLIINEADIVHNIASKRPSQLFCNNNHSSRRLDLLLFSFPTARIHFICFSIWNVVIWQVWDSVWPEIDFFYSWPMNPSPLASFLSSSPRFFGKRRKQLFIFVKRCAQTPVFQWQLAFSQIGAKNGKNWQYRVTGKLCI